jgi:hypothetical protein
MPIAALARSAGRTPVAATAKGSKLLAAHALRALCSGWCGNGIATARAPCVRAQPARALSLARARSSRCYASILLRCAACCRPATMCMRNPTGIRRGRSGRGGFGAASGTGCAVCGCGLRARDHGTRRKRGDLPLLRISHDTYIYIITHTLFAIGNWLIIINKRKRKEERPEIDIYAPLSSACRKPLGSHDVCGGHACGCCSLGIACTAHRSRRLRPTSQSSRSCLQPRPAACTSQSNSEGYNVREA